MDPWDRRPLYVLGMPRSYPPTPVLLELFEKLKIVKDHFKISTIACQIYFGPTRDAHIQQRISETSLRSLGEGFVDC